MKKALKILLWTVGGILALVLLLVLAIPLWLGPTVVAVANKVAPEYTGTPFSLAGASINPYTGKYSITKLELGNPEGYPVPTAFSVSNVTVIVDMASLLTDTIHIREIVVDNPYASYVSKDGTNNFERIAENAKAKVGVKEEKGEKEEAKEEKGASKKVVIDKLTIAGTRVKLKILPEMPIPTITLTDIGKEKGGSSWEEVGQTLTDAFMKSTSAVGDGLTSALGALGDGAGSLMSGATNVLGGAADVLGGATTNVLGGATKALGDTAKKIGNLGGLLGGEDNAAKAKDAAKASETNKPAGGGVIDAGKSAGKGVLDAGKALGNGALDAGKSIGKGAADTGKAIGDGLKKLNPFGK